MFLRLRRTLVQLVLYSASKSKKGFIYFGVNGWEKLHIVPNAQECNAREVDKNIIAGFKKNKAVYLFKKQMLISNLNKHYKFKNITDVRTTV